jgi:methylmalonyl-CoA mutase
VGTNYQINPQDRMKDTLELFPFVKKNPVKTLVEPVIPKRLSEALEQKRLNEEK